jgi:hypothetical protein
MLTIFFIEMFIYYVQQTLCIFTSSSFYHTCAISWPINLIKLLAICSRSFQLINSSNSHVFHFLSTIVLSSEKTRLIANRNPSLYDSSIFNLFNSLSVICGKSFLNLSSELIGFFLFDFFSGF